MLKDEYIKNVQKTHSSRILWWKKARFGLFIHFGLYSILGDHEWCLCSQNLDIEKYSELTLDFNIDEDSIEEWVKLASASGMKYVVLTTRHHEGFSLWDSKVNHFNSVNYGPRLDIVRIFVEKCREYKLKIGFYFSLMDWYHPMAYKCAFDRAANNCFTSYVKEMVRELLSNYGTIDILWYDIPRPMESPEGWDSIAMNVMARQLQPNIIINNRSRLPEDFRTPEEHLGATSDGAWEACMTFNGLSWGWLDSEYTKFYNYSPQQIIHMLGKVTSQDGNLLLNVGPDRFGRIPDCEKHTLELVGKWIEQNKEAIENSEGKSKIYRANDLCVSTGAGNIAYVWNLIWPSQQILRLGGKFNKLLDVSVLNSGKKLAFSQSDYHIEILLPSDFPEDEILGITVFKLEFQGEIQYARSTRYPQIMQGKTY